MANAKSNFEARVAKAVVDCIQGKEFDALVMERVQEVFGTSTVTVKTEFSPVNVKRGRPKGSKTKPRPKKAPKQRAKRGSVPKLVVAAVKDWIGDFRVSELVKKIQETEPFVSDVAIQQAVKSAEGRLIERAGKDGRAIIYRAIAGASG